MVLHANVCCLIFFFFQAEDGIRDWSVTGVQTCALPICTASRHWPAMTPTSTACRESRAMLPDEPGVAAGHADRAFGSRWRSEERRVGKEWRAGGGGAG